MVWICSTIYHLPVAVSPLISVVPFWINCATKGKPAGFPFVAQLIQNGTTEINGDTATGRWYIVEHIQTTEKDADGNPVGFFNIGVYQDKYIKENGKWLFKLRKYAVLYNDNGTGNMTGTANPYPDLIK